MNEFIRMPFSGVVSFLGMPLANDIIKFDSVDIGFAGIPYDMGTTNRSGTRFGPRAVREASLQYTYHKSPLFNTTNPELTFPGLWDINNKRFMLKNVKMFDAGDVSIVPADPLKSFANITGATAQLLSKQVFPVFVGGDHSITYPILKAYSQYDQIHVVHFDTHIDTWENVGQAELGHGSPLFLAQKLPQIKTITHLGLHGFLNDEDRFAEAVSKKHNVITADDIHNNKSINFDKLLPVKDTYYLTFDIDVCDPAYAPGTGTPEYGGLSPVQVFGLLKEVCKGRNFVGMDLVEVCPPFDHANITALLAVQILLVALDSIQG